MGKLEKVIVLSVLAVIAVILVVSLTLDDPLNKEKVVMAGGSSTKAQAAEAAAQPPIAKRPENANPVVNPLGNASAALPEVKTAATVQPQPVAQSSAPVTLAAATKTDKPAGAAPSPLLNSTVLPAKQDAPAGVPPGSILKASDGLQESYLADMRFYTWQSGDTFRSVAAKYYGDPARFTILRRSNEGRDVVQPGEKILVPVFDLDAPRPGDAFAAAPTVPAASAASNTAAHAKAVPATTPAASTSAAHKTADGSSGPRVHTVLDGESLWKIAKLELGDGARWNEIFEANRDVLSKPEAVHSGLKLRIPVK